MRTAGALLALALVAAPGAAPAVGPTVIFTLPAQDATPSVFGSLPFPCDLYFDGGKPADGDGTLIGAGASIGLATDVVRSNTASVEDGLDLLDGFGTTTATWFFLSGPIDPPSLPASPVLAPTLADAVFCADVATLTPVPIMLEFDFDTRIRNVLAVVPVPGHPLAAKTTYTCVVRRAVTGGGDPVQPSADWASVRDGASANTDADAIFDPVVAALDARGVTASDIAGMTVFTTQSTTDYLLRIRDVVLPGLAVPSADLTSRPELVFAGADRVTALLGSSAHDHLAVVATGFYPSPRFQTHDPNGDGPLADLPLPPDFVTCAAPGNACETTDERFTRDGTGNPVVIDVPSIPFTLAIPTGTPPAGGWPVVIQQHGLGAQRDTVLGFAEADAARGFASIGIDAAQHGYRLFDCGPAAPCSQDTSNTVGGTAVPDGFVDGGFLGFDVGFLAVNLGFFQAFHNFLGIRDNFRQTYADLLSLVRLIQGHSIDAALGTQLDDARIFYMGHSLGGLMGSGFVPIDTTTRAALLNATGGGLTTRLFVNSSVGADAIGLVNGILGLDPAMFQDQFAFLPNLTQTILDPADAINSASLLLSPVPHNVIQVEDLGDQVVPNQGSDALAVAAGLPIFDPFVQNLPRSALSLPVVATPFMVGGNAAGGAVTAALVQNGPATHAQSLIVDPGTLTFVPGYAREDDFRRTGNGFPTLARPIRVPNAGILDAVLAWFADVAAHGPPGTFRFTGLPNYNPVENLDAPSGASTERFFARTVDAGGQTPFPEPTPDVVVDFAANAVASRITAARSILGSTPAATDDDVPPGGASTVGTPGFLPFFVTLQRALPGTFSASVTIAYTEQELALAGIPAAGATPSPALDAEAALVVAAFSPGTCTAGGAACAEDGDCGANGPCAGSAYVPLPTTVDTAAHTATATGVSELSTFAVLHPGVLSGGPVAPLVLGLGRRRTECRLQWEIISPASLQLRKRGVWPFLACRDGDPTCDGDRAADGTCVFRVAPCFGIDPPQAGRCQRASTTAFALRVRTHRKEGALEKATAQALLANVAAIRGLAVTGRAVRFRRPLPPGLCAPLTDVRVPAGTSDLPPPMFLHGLVKTLRGSDQDTVGLSCLPAR
jgi:hypothetical protein